jgi:hypothetical protein
MGMPPSMSIIRCRAACSLIPLPLEMSAIIPFAPVVSMNLVVEHLESAYFCFCSADIIHQDVEPELRIG